MYNSKFDVFVYLYKSMREKDDDLWTPLNFEEKNHGQNKFQQSSLTICPGRTQIITQTL